MGGRMRQLIRLGLRAAGLWLAINGLRCLLALRTWGMGGEDK